MDWHWHISCGPGIMTYFFIMYVGGKLGFYYKDHEILPPLPGNVIFVFVTFAPLLL